MIAHPFRFACRVVLLVLAVAVWTISCGPPPRAMAAPTPNGYDQGMARFSVARVGESILYRIGDPGGFTVPVPFAEQPGDPILTDAELAAFLDEIVTYATN